MKLQDQQELLLHISAVQAETAPVTVVIGHEWNGTADPGRTVTISKAPHAALIPIMDWVRNRAVHITMEMTEKGLFIS